MSGKQHKREKKRIRDAQRAAAARAERQRTIYTVIVIAVVVAIGGLLVAVSVDDGDAVAEGAADASPSPAVQAAPCAPAAAPDSAGADKSTFDQAPSPDLLSGGQDYRAVIETSCGTVVVDLLEQAAPQAVANFVFLADEGFYDGLQVFRNARSIFALQSGAGDDQATWQIGYTFPDELAAAEEEGYTPGSVAMANSGPDTNGSQFFFVYGQSPLPPDYTKFGQVVEGLDVLESIGAIPVEGETPTEDVYLETVSIEAAGADAPTASPAVSPPPSPAVSPPPSPPAPPASPGPAATGDAPSPLPPE